MDQITCHCEEYLNDPLPFPIELIPVPKNAKPPTWPAWVHERRCGQTALYSNYQWIYNPNALTAATLNQIARLSMTTKFRAEPERKLADPTL
jgi:hypothetical protein